MAKPFQWPTTLHIRAWRSSHYRIQIHSSVTVVRTKSMRRKRWKQSWPDTGSGQRMSKKCWTIPAKDTINSLARQILWSNSWHTFGGGDQSSEPVFRNESKGNGKKGSFNHCWCCCYSHCCKRNQEGRQSSEKSQHGPGATKVKTPSRYNVRRRIVECYARSREKGKRRNCEKRMGRRFGHKWVRYIELLTYLLDQFSVWITHLFFVNWASVLNSIRLYADAVASTPKCFTRISEREKKLEPISLSLLLLQVTRIWLELQIFICVLHWNEGISVCLGNCFTNYCRSI